MPDTVFTGAFRVGKVIGEGAMGTVYWADRLDGSGPCALKVLKPSIASDQIKATERFGREARVGEKIGNPHIVEVFTTGFDEHTGLHWLAMEYLEGLSLPEYIQRRTPPHEVRLLLLTHLFEAMSAAHQAGVLHRDLKPENLFVVAAPEGPSLKVLDFGVAKTMREGMIASATEGGLGTPLWTSPEQGKGGEHMRPSVDVWALGLLTFFILTGKIYWRHCNIKRSSMLDIAKEMLRDPIEAASLREQQLDVAGMLPHGIDPWFARCVIRDVEQRYADATEVQMEWQRVLAGQPLVGRSLPPPASLRPGALPPSSRPPPSSSAPPVTTRSAYPEAHVPRNIVLVAIIVLLVGVVATMAAWIMLR
jgi:serine/threonine protein kinase